MFTTTGRYRRTVRRSEQRGRWVNARFRAPTLDRYWPRFSLGGISAIA